MAADANRILVAYFSHSGTTRRAAERIGTFLKADLLEIATVDRYPQEYSAVVEQAKKEQRSNFRPRLATRIGAIEKYGTLILGFPSWWGTAPMAVFTFLEARDLAGKKILPFCANEGSGLGSSIGDIKRACPRATVLPGLSIRGSGIASSWGAVEAWLRANLKL